jgi:hypothetical protein
MNLLFIHGRSQERKDESALKKTWQESFMRGCQAAGVVCSADTVFHFPYYGDLLFDESEKLARATYGALAERGGASDMSTAERDFRREIILEAAHAQGVTDAKIEAETKLAVQDRGLFNWPMVLAALRLLDRIPNVTSTCVELLTRDVWHYLTDKGVRMTVNRKVAQALPKDEPCVVVAHSLGTIVGYNLLMDLQQRSRIKAFLTLGSPLGIPAITRRLPSDSPPRRAPSGVGIWLNARDPRDTVALRDLTPEMFSGAPVVENYSSVANESENRHGISFYLSDPFVARRIWEALR